MRIFQYPKVNKLVLYCGYNLKSWKVGLGWSRTAWTRIEVEYPVSASFNIYFLCFGLSLLWKYPHDMLREMN